MKRSIALAAAFAACILAAACTSRPAGNQPGAQPTVSGSSLPASQTDHIQAALNSIKAAAQASVLAKDFSAALHGHPVFPAGTSVRLQPATLHVSGDYATVRITVAEPGGKPASFAMLLTRPHTSSLWQVLTLLPATAKTAYEVDGSPSVPRHPAATGGCMPIAVPGKTPIILVHGFNGGPGVWGQPSDPASMRGRISTLNGVQVGAFDYSSASLKWVTDPRIGAYLAGQITCLAELSHRKVVVVAHSMGGLALREALKEQPQIANSLGLVVTIGTPNDGSQIDAEALGDVRAFCAVVECGDAVGLLTTVVSALPGLATGSPQIAELNKARWPITVPLYAIAGNIAPQHLVLRWANHLPHLVAVQGQPSNSDTLVTTGSALHGNPVGGLGGTREFGCATTAFVVLPFVARATCEHNALLSNSDVQAAVVAQIAQYLARQRLRFRQLSGIRT